MSAHLFARPLALAGLALALAACDPTSPVASSDVDSKIAAHNTLSSAHQNMQIYAANLQDKVDGSTQIKPGSIVGGDIGAGVVDGTVHILAGSISSSDLAAGSVGTNQLQLGAVTGAKVAAGAISTAEIAAAAGILGTQLANGTITALQISPMAGITGAQLSATANITGAQLAAAAGITGAQLAAAANIAGTQLANATITATQISGAANIAGSQLAANAGITGAQLAANAGITGGQLAAAANIAGTQLANNTVTATQLANNTITGAQLNVDIYGRGTNNMATTILTFTIGAAAQIDVSFACGMEGNTAGTMKALKNGTAFLTATCPANSAATPAFFAQAGQAVAAADTITLQYSGAAANDAIQWRYVSIRGQ